MGSNMEIFEARFLGGNISFELKKPIQDNDNYKPHAKYYSNLSMFTQIIA
jgi:hypothetical protein